jgi:hypothetical protein
MVFLNRIKVFFLKVFAYVKNYLYISGVVAILILSILLFMNKKKINRLKVDVELLKAKLKVETLALENCVSLSKVETLKEKDEKIRKELKEVEDRLIKVAAEVEMTPEEILNAFKKIYGK